MIYTLMDNENVVIKCSKLKCSQSKLKRRGCVVVCTQYFLYHAVLFPQV